MDCTAAQELARSAHLGHVGRTGEPLIDHVERVANAVPEEMRAIAYLHDVLERGGSTVAELRASGLTRGELTVLKLLTRGREESYDAHVTRIAGARGIPGRIARAIKLADLDDHLSAQAGGERAPGFADYGRAREQIAQSCLRHGEDMSRWTSVRGGVRAA